MGIALRGAETATILSFRQSPARRPPRSSRAEWEMAKTYGGRWERLDNNELGHGGQGTVFRVRDVTGRHAGEAALKRVPDVQRRERFLREIEAIKRLTDPATQQAHLNIISLIDHSALDDAPNPDKQYLVMPIAHGGYVSGDPGRLALYKNSVGRRSAGRQATHGGIACRSRRQNHSSRREAGEHSSSPGMAMIFGSATLVSASSARRRASLRRRK